MAKKEDYRGKENKDFMKKFGLSVKKHGKEMIEQFKDAAAELETSLDDVLEGVPGKVKKFVKNPLGAALVGSTAILKDFSSSVDSIGKSFGAIGVKNFSDDLLTARSEVNKIGLGMSDVTDISNTLANDFGVSFKDSIGLAGQVGDMSVALGMSAAEGTKLFGTLTKIGGLTSEQAVDLAKSAESLATANGVAPSAVMKDVADNTEMFARFGKDGGKNILNASIQAKKLGTNLSTVAGIMDGMLDFQSSIEKEMEASIILGRQLNYQKARELALNNDIEGAMSEIISQVGSEEEFNKLNAIQRKALADSIGVSADQMAKFVSNQDKAATLGDQIDKQDGFEKMVGKDAISDLSQVVFQLKSIGAAFTKVLGPVLNLILKPISMLVGWFGEFNAAAKVASIIIGGLLVPTLLKYLIVQGRLIKGNIWQNALAVKNNWLTGISIIRTKALTVGTWAMVAAKAIASKAAIALGVSLNFALLGIPALIAAITGGVILLYKNWDKVSSFFKTHAPKIKSALKIMFAPLMLAWEAAKFIGKGFGKLFGGGGGGDTSTAAPQNDFVMRPGQKATPFSAQDTIIGFKGAGPGGGSDMTPVVASVNLLKEEMTQLRKDMSGYFGVGGTTVKGIGQCVVSNIEATQGV